MQSIGEIMGQTMTQIDTTTRNQPSEPEPWECEFCKAKLRWKPLPHFLDESRVFMWLKPNRCECEGANEHWAKVDREQMEKAEEERRVAEENDRIKKLKSLFGQSQLPERFKQRTFENYKLTKDNRKAYETAKRYVEKFGELKQSGTGLLLTGPVGTGKTHLAAAITTELINQCHSVIFGTVTNLLGKIRATYEDDSKYKERQVIDQLINVSLLVIDDLGKEKPTEWVEQTLYEIINTRYENNKPLLITSNIDIKDISKNYPRTGEAIESRIIEMCHGLKCDWQDFRKNRLI